jgi:putative transposase
MIERLFRRLKEECVWQESFVPFNEAFDKIAGWIDHYNRERPHSALDYATPFEIRYGLVA